MFPPIVQVITHMLVWKTVKRAQVLQCYGPVSTLSGSAQVLLSHITMGTVSRGQRVCEQRGEIFKVSLGCLGQNAGCFLGK